MTRGLYAAIEAGGTKWVCALGSSADGVVTSTRLPTVDPQSTLAAAHRWLEQAAHTFGPPRALGIASFGPVELDPAAPHYGCLLDTPKRGWSGTDLLAPFRAWPGVPIALDTDVNAAALSEQALGAGRGLDSLAYLTIGTGIGLGVVVHGRMLHGLLHPEAGHLTPRRAAGDTGFAGICPFHGDCFEGLASGPALVARLGHELGDAPDDHPVWTIEADYLGQLCAQVALALSPRRIVLGGGVMQHAKLLPALRARALHWLGGYLPPLRTAAAMDDYLVPPALGQRSGILGALLLAERA